MSMIENFFSIKGKEENRKFFWGLNIEKNEVAMKEFREYLVINISFKNIKGDNFEITLEKTKELISELYKMNKENVSVIDETDEKTYSDIMTMTAPKIKYESALKKLSGYMERYYGKKVIILLDEYDQPIDNAYNNEFYDEAINFFRSIFGITFKGNNSLKFAVLTGVLKVTSESLFSEFNNLESKIDDMPVADLRVPNKEIHLELKK